MEADLFEAVIGLAANLFSGASIPVAICVLNKAKPAERRGKVLFVDAAQEGSFRQGRGAELYRQGTHRQDRRGVRAPSRTWTASPTWQTWRRCGPTTLT